MTIVHVVESVACESSGPSYTVVRLCEAMIAAGVDVELATLDSDPRRRPPFLRQFPRGRGPARLGGSPALRRWLDARVRGGRAEIVHVHSLWRLSLIYHAWAVRQGRAKLVVSPRGALSHRAMRSGSPAKRPFWVALQRPALQRAACLHATSDLEYEEMRRLGFRQPVAVIPNGVDLPAPRPEPPRGHRTLLFLGRLHPIKGVDTLIDAWTSVQARFPAWRLVIAGAEDGSDGSRGHGDALRRRAAARGAERVSFAGELLGRAKWEAYAKAEVYVLPSRSEGFGLTVAEALAAGTPAITTRATPWQALQARGAGWCVATGAAPLAAGLCDALARDEATLEAMGRRGRRWMAADFSWRDIGRRMAQTCEWLLGARPRKPDWVRVD